MTNPSAVVSVVTAGLVAVQDAGRYGYTDVGVPISGPWNRTAYNLLTQLADADGRPAGTRQPGMWQPGLPGMTANPMVSVPSVPVFELVAGVFTFTMTTNAPGQAVPGLAVAFTGPATLTLSVTPGIPDLARGIPHQSPTISTRALVVPPLTLIPIPGTEPGGTATVSVTHVGPGPAYILLTGLTAPTVLGSAATDIHAGFGTPVQPGNQFVCEPQPVTHTHEPGIPFPAFIHPRPHTPTQPRETFTFTPHDDTLATWITGNTWAVTQLSRTGIRLQRQLRPEPDTAPVTQPTIPTGIPSYPTVTGLIQIPSPHELIILGPDAGTTGGYPTAGVITTPHIPDLSQLTPNQLTRFTPQPAPAHVRDNSHRSAPQPHTHGTRHTPRVYRGQPTDAALINNEPDQTSPALPSLFLVRHLRTPPPPSQLATAQPTERCPTERTPGNDIRSSSLELRYSSQGGPCFL